jgi:hypothetical protein
VAQCPYCERDLPGTERLCRACWEKQYAGKSPRQWWRWRFQELWPSLAIAALIWAGATLLPASVINALFAFRRFVLTTSDAVDFLLIAIAAGLAIWDSWRNRSWPRLAFWITGIFAVVAWALWIANVGRIWQIASLVSTLASVSFRIMSKARELWQE